MYLKIMTGKYTNIHWQKNKEICYTECIEIINGVSYKTRGGFSNERSKSSKNQYGTFCNMTEPEGYPLSGEIHKFYPDRISGTCVGSMAFSPIAVRKDERVVKMAEYHTTTWEGIVALDDDMIIHVAPASGGTPVPELAKAFIVPKGYMVKINAAIWHLCPLPLNNDELHAMIILPECTYANDCTVVEFEEKDWFKITE